MTVPLNMRSYLESHCRSLGSEMVDHLLSSGPFEGDLRNAHQMSLYVPLVYVAYIIRGSLKCGWGVKRERN
jgi:hypothetical protein